MYETKATAPNCRKLFYNKISPLFFLISILEINLHFTSYEIFVEKSILQA